MFRIRNPTSSAPGPELKENDRVWSVPGTWTFTYWPGRNPSDDRLSTLTENAIAVSDNRSIEASSPA